MDTNSELRISPTRGAMTIGAFTAGVMLVVSIVNVPVLVWLVFVGGIYLGMRTYKKVLDGIIIYSRALNVGFQTAFFASLIMAFFAYVTITFKPSLINTMFEVAEQRLKTSGAPSELVDTAVQQWRGIFSPLMFAVVMIFMYSVIGGLVSIVCALFVKNAKPGKFVEY